MTDAQSSQWHEFGRNTNNNKYFGRLDFNLGSGHQLTVRHNYVDALTDDLQSLLASDRGRQDPRN